MGFQYGIVLIFGQITLVLLRIRKYYNKLRIPHARNIPFHRGPGQSPGHVHQMGEEEKVMPILRWRAKDGKLSSKTCA